MTSTPEPPVRVETAGAVTYLTLDSPHNRNALSVAMLSGLADALRAAFADGAVRVLVLTGAGPVFCSGADLKEQRAYRERGEPSPVSDLLAEVLRLVLDSPKPVVARVNGAARAGGLGLIGASDIVVADEGATFGFAEVRIGVVPAVIAVTVGPRLTPRAALELFLTGEVFDAGRAVTSGLINVAVPTDRLDAEVDRYVRMLLLGGPTALAAIKPMLSRLRALPTDDAFVAMARLSAERFGSDEGQEGMRAFLGKRPPAWVPPSGSS